jgi:hypothetical protein
VVLAIGFMPSKPVLFLLLGLVPMLVWVPKSWLQLDASRTPHALASGFLVTGLNLSAGVAGPLLDIFFVRTEPQPAPDRRDQGGDADVQPSRQDHRLWRTAIGRRRRCDAALVGVCIGHPRLDAGHDCGGLGARPAE